MKFARTLRELRLPEWQEYYVDYSSLKKMVGVAPPRTRHAA